MQVMQYRVNNERRTRKLRQLSRVASPEDLRGEISVARLLCQESLEGGNVGLSNLLLTTVGKLARDQTALKRTNEEYIERAAARRLVERLCKVVTKALEGRVPGWEEIVDNIADELTTTVETKGDATNE